MTANDTVGQYKDIITWPTDNFTDVYVTYLNSRYVNLKYDQSPIYPVYSSIYYW